ncbi:MAG: DeoR/GlpR transcriptional regulator [Planctomycetes bacterium]|nr:DeoR/GlpR transcriptional regulator [Planctomycetota bacterium]
MADDLSIEERREKLSELLSLKGFMPLSELVETLGVSDSTIRRDLEVLENQGQIERTRGGAVCLSDTPGHRLAFAERQSTAANEKRVIARAVAELIPPGQTIVLDGGTTCLEVARAIRSRRLSVITNSIPIASLLSTDITTEVTLIGGYVYPRTGVALGAAASRHIETLHATQAVLSCAGITSDGAFNANEMMVQAERKMMQIADEVILVADHTKFARRSVVLLAEMDRFNVIVTDDGCDERTRRWLADQPARVIYAELDQ